MTVVLIRPVEGTDNISRPTICPYCSGHVLQRWGQVSKTVEGVSLSKREIRRYRCLTCKRTFRHYPEGIDRSRLSKSIRQLAAIAFALGLSCREIEEIFSDIGLAISRSTIERYGAKLSKQLKQKVDSDTISCMRFIKGLMPDISNPAGTIIIIEAKQGNQKVLGMIDEWDMKKVISYLEFLGAGTVSILPTETGRQTAG